MHAWQPFRPDTARRLPVATRQLPRRGIVRTAPPGVIPVFAFLDADCHFPYLRGLTVLDFMDGELNRPDAIPLIEIAWA